MTNPHNAPMPECYHNVLNSLKRLDEKGVLYEMEYDADYYQLEDLLNSVPRPGCSTFTAFNTDKEAIMGRNYDFSHYPHNKKTEPKDLTGLSIIVHGKNPKAKYHSVGVADAFWLSGEGNYYAGVIDDGKTDITPLAVVPFVCMDAMNSQGLAVSIMYLEAKSRWEEIEYRTPDEKTIVLKKEGEEPDPYDIKGKDGVYAVNETDHRAWICHKEKASVQKEEGKKTVMHSVLMRMMVDYCADVEEALQMAHTVNVESAFSYANFHVLVADRHGNSKLLEWVNGTMNVIDCTHATNYYCTLEGNPGMGKRRDAILETVLDKYAKGMPERVAEDLLSVVSQDSRDGSDIGFTQWSSIYNLAQSTLRLYIQMDYAKAYTFKAD